MLLQILLSLARSHRRLIWKYAILCGLWNRNCIEKITSTTLWIYFFNFSFFCPQPKAEADFFICACFFCCVICLFQCSAVITLVRFFVVSFFFVFPQIRHSGFGRLYQSSDALVGGIVGIRLTPSFVIIFFWQHFFFYDAAKNYQSFSFGCQRGRISNYRNSSALINNCGNFNVFFLVTYNKMENKQVIE